MVVDVPSLETGYFVAEIVGGLGAPAVIVWCIKRLRRADNADNADRTAAAITAALAPLVEKVETVSQRTARIEGQFYNNGGSTLRDKVDALGRTASETNGTLEEHLEQSREDRQRLSAVEQILMQRGAGK